MMTIDSVSKAKRIYSAPTLVSYGDMVKLTKSGTGSITEMGSSNPNRKP